SKIGKVITSLYIEQLQGVGGAKHPNWFANLPGHTNNNYLLN
ncbi:MAG: hypothetical protein ACI83B_002860, partial [Sediminicola sp.]